MNAACAARFARAIALAAAAGATAVPQARAQEAYPAASRIITIVVPFSLGTGPDMLARMFGQKLSERWKAGVIVENKPGASGNIGTEAVARAPADGYTLLLTAASFAANPALDKTNRYDPVKSFAPVCMVGTAALAFAVSAETSAKSVGEFIALAKARPGRLNYASSGNGTPQHLVMELFKLAAQVDVVHVPYKDTAAATRDLAGGHVDAMIIPVHGVAPLVQAGKARVLAVLSKERSSVFPAAPTLNEEGFGGVEAYVWFALLAPAGTPSGVVGKLNREINIMLSDDDVKETFARQGLTATGGPPETVTAIVKADFERWVRVIAEARIQPD